MNIIVINKPFVADYEINRRYQFIFSKQGNYRFGKLSTTNTINNETSSKTENFFDAFLSVKGPFLGELTTKHSKIESFFFCKLFVK